MFTKTKMLKVVPLLLVMLVPLASGAESPVCVVPEGHTDPEIKYTDLLYVTGSNTCTEVHLFFEVLMRCEDRYCCKSLCNCEPDNLLVEGTTTCGHSDYRTEPVNLRCYVEHKNSFYSRKVCCSGYEQKGVICVDIDECEDNPCGNKTCHNLPGSYECLCPEGTTKDATDPDRCNDIDECDEVPAPCQHSCHNTHGSYVCSCRPGFSLQASGECSVLYQTTEASTGPGKFTDEGKMSGFRLYITVSIASLAFLVAILLILLFLRRKFQGVKKAPKSVRIKSPAFSNDAYGVSDGSRVEQGAVGGDTGIYEDIDDKVKRSWGKEEKDPYSVLPHELDKGSLEDEDKTDDVKYWAINDVTKRCVREDCGMKPHDSEKPCTGGTSSADDKCDESLAEDNEDVA